MARGCRTGHAARPRRKSPVSLASETKVPLPPASTSLYLESCHPFMISRLLPVTSRATAGRSPSPGAPPGRSSWAQPSSPLHRAGRLGGSAHSAPFLVSVSPSERLHTERGHKAVRRASGCARRGGGDTSKRAHLSTPPWLTVRQPLPIQT